MNCARCLDSGLVANDRPRTPWPTVLADPQLDFDRREGIIRPERCPDCGGHGTTQEGGWADGYVSGHRAALDAARRARDLSGTALPIAMTGRRWRVGRECGDVFVQDGDDRGLYVDPDLEYDGLTLTIEIRDQAEADAVAAALEAATR